MKPFDKHFWLATEQQNKANAFVGGMWMTSGVAWLLWEPPDYTISVWERMGAAVPSLMVAVSFGIVMYCLLLAIGWSSTSRNSPK